MLENLKNNNGCILTFDRNVFYSFQDKDYLATKLPGQFVLPVQTTPSPRVVPACQCQQPRTVEISTQTDPMVLTEEFALDVTERCTEEDIVGAQVYLLEYYHTTVM